MKESTKSVQKSVDSLKMVYKMAGLSSVCGFGVSWDSMAPAIIFMLTKSKV